MMIKTATYYKGREGMEERSKAKRNGRKGREKTRKGREKGREGKRKRKCPRTHKLSKATRYKINI